MQRPLSHRFFAYALIFTLVGSLFSVVLPAFQPSYASHENITVNIGIDDVTDVYEPDDQISIEGVIDEEVENEDVIIRVKDPGGSTAETENFGEPGSGGVFDHLYEIPNNADDGVWTVEVEYDGEFGYTYFKVDDEDDTITVVVDCDDNICEAGEEVTISGQVETEDIDEEPEVEITVLDPIDPDDPIVDSVDIELGDTGADDEFEYEFTLDDEASHGRYAVIVTYDVDDQEGSTLFEIEDTDSGSNGDDDNDSSGDTVTEDSEGDLSAEIPDATYEQGGTVAITGTIEDYDPDDDEELSISIRNPDDLEIEEDDDVSIEEDGSDGIFEFEYDIADDADEGLYTITITYNNDEVVLAFEVEESAGGGNNDDDDDDPDVTAGVTSGDLTAKLNRASYLAGEMMVVSGEVDELKEDEDDNPERVFILLYRPNGAVVLEASENVEPSSNGAFSANVILDTDYDLEDDDGYWITVTYVDDEVRLPFDITGVTSTPTNEITVETNSAEYSIGDTVEISGEVPDSLIEEGQQLLIRVNTPEGNPCRIDPIDLPSSGTFSYELVLGGVCGVAGEYEVEVTYGDEEAGTSFELIGSSASEYNLNVDGDNYPIEYELSDGSINSMFVRPTEDKLVINIDAEENGQLTVVLPREVIDAVEDGEDIDFVVTIEDESGDVIEVDVEESDITDDERTLVIDYPAGAARIEIQGTQVVPEFGAIAGIIMAAAIVGIILGTARYSKLNLFRQ